jgi:two-component system sensor histidine kinase BaeS
MRWRISFRASLSGKFLLSYLLIVLVGVATLLVVTFALAPTLFQAQLVHILQTHPGAMTTTEAIQRILGDFLGTLFIALAVAAIVATGTSLATSLFVARRITVPLRQMTQVSQRISAGHYAERIVIAPVHATDELGQLASSINVLAVALEQTERRRLEVIGNVAHELRTPIATLEGYLEGLLDGIIEPSPGTLAMLHTEAGRLRRLVDDLQELSRAEARQIPLSLQPVAPQRLVQDALEPLEGQFAEKGLELQIHVPEDPPQVMADPARAVQILTNILVNALRFTPAPGKATVDVSCEEAMVAFRISDTGVGLSPE